MTGEGAAVAPSLDLLAGRTFSRDVIPATPRPSPLIEGQASATRYRCMRVSQQCAIAHPYLFGPQPQESRKASL